MVLRLFEGGCEVAALCEERSALCEEGGGFCEERGGSRRVVPRLSARSAAVLCEENCGSLRGAWWFSARSAVARRCSARTGGALGGVATAAAQGLHASSSVKPSYIVAGYVC